MHVLTSIDTYQDPGDFLNTLPKGKHSPYGGVYACLYLDGSFASLLGFNWYAICDSVTHTNGVSVCYNVNSSVIQPVICPTLHGYHVTLRHLATDV